MNNRSRISAGQLMLIFLLARIMHTMLYRLDGFQTGTPLMLGQLLATAAEAVMALPAVIWFSKRRENPAAALGAGASRAVSTAYALYFTVIAGVTVALFAEFLQTKFSDTVMPGVAAAILCASAAYCAWGGIEGLGRAATVVFWLFVGMFVLMAAVSEGSFEPLNLLPLSEGDGGRTAEYLTESLSSAWWIPMLCALGHHLKSGAAKAAYGYLIMKFAIVETLLLLITLVLWRYVGVLGYPILALGAYAKSDFIQRFDAINMLVWAINCVLVLGVYVMIGSGAFKKTKPGAIFAAAAAAAFGWWQYKRGVKFDEPWYICFKLCGIILLGIILPLTALALSGRKKENAL